MVEEGLDWTHVDSVAEDIARESSTSLSRKGDPLELEIPLEQIPVATNVEESLRSLVKQCESQIAQLDAALASGPCKFTVDFRPWPNVDLLDHIGKLKIAAELLQRTAILHADAGKKHEALQALLWCFLLARVLADEPTTISQLGLARIFGLAIDGVEQVLTRCELTRDDLDEIEEAAAKSFRADGHIRACAGEICLVTSGGGLENDRPEWVVARIWNYVPSWWSWRLVYELPLKAMGVEELRALFYVALSRRYMSALAHPDDTIATAINRYYASSLMKIDQLIDSSPPGSLIGVMPNIVPISMRTRYNALRAGLAVERYRLDNGRMPDSLAELVPQYLERIPLSVHDGMPLRFEKPQTGYEILPALPSEGEAEPSMSRSAELSEFRVFR